MSLVLPNFICILKIHIYGLFSDLFSKINKYARKWRRFLDFKISRAARYSFQKCNHFGPKMFVCVCGCMFVCVIFWCVVVCMCFLCKSLFL